MRGTSVAGAPNQILLLVFGPTQPDGMTMIATCIRAGRMERVYAAVMSDHIRLIYL